MKQYVTVPLKYPFFGIPTGNLSPFILYIQVVLTILAKSPDNLIQH